MTPDGDDAVKCDACGALIEGEPAGRGLLAFPRGDGVRYEEPPLCAECAHAIGMRAIGTFVGEDEES